MNSATPEQLDAFQKGAAARYAERGVPPEQAVQLFAAHMDKLSEYIAPTPPPAKPTHTPPPGVPTNKPPVDKDVINNPPIKI